MILLYSKKTLFSIK